MLKFNSYRAKRYLRSKFVEGKYLLASEATDLELEVLEVLRNVVRNTIGDVAVADAWKVQKLSDTELLIKPGEAWFKGLPFQFRSGKDQLISGAVLSSGITPVGVTMSDDASGLGKIIKFNDGSTTPTNLYRLVVTAKEELLTEVDDAFLQNANLTESTAQKIRLIFQLNLVPDSLQTESPISYRDESSTSVAVTNFPNTGGFAAPNLVNQITVNPVAAGNGELISLNLITGSEKIDGRDLELILRNDTALGGGHPIPKAPTEQQAFANGTLIDSYGNRYHINAIFNDVVSTQVVIRIDKEPDQPNPQIINTLPFTLVKREVFVTDDINGQPQGKLFWPIATVNWHQSNLLVHESSIVDLRTRVSKLSDFEIYINNKEGLRLSDGGTLAWNLTTQMVSWSAGLTLVNPHGPNQTIALASIPLVEGGSLAYDLNLQAGGPIQKGTLAINITAFGATSTLAAVALNQVKIGNIVVDSAGTVAEITAVNDITNTITTSPALAANGAATIYYDSFGPGKAPLSEKTYILAVRKSNKVFLGYDDTGLSNGETTSVGQGISNQLLTFIGATGEDDAAPNYASNFYITDGQSLVTAISNLDAALNALSGVVGAISWKAPVANFAALPVVGNVDGDVRLVLDTRIAYTWHSATTDWRPVNGTGGGIKIIGGGTVTNTTNGANQELSFTSNLQLEISGLAYTDNQIAIASSPIVFASTLQVAYVIPNLVSGGPLLTVTVGALNTVPKNAVIIARREGTDVIVGSSSTRLLAGQSSKLYSQTSDQTLSYIGAPDSADATPTYSSDIRGAANQNLTARLGALTDAEGDAQEDRSSYLRADQPVTWSGSQLTFTTDIVLEIVNTKSGTVTQHTVQVANSPLSLANGESAWVLINRLAATENLTLNKSNTTPIPAQTQANKDVLVLFRRQDALSVGYLHIPLHKQVLEPGQTVRLGASGSGDGGGNEILESLKNQLVDSYFELATSNIFKVDKDTKVDGSSTGAYSLVDRTFNFSAIGQTFVSTQMLDLSEFLINTDALTEVELSAYWRLSDIDTAAVYEVSRNGGLAWQTVTMDRVGFTDLYRGYHKFTDEVTNQNLYTPAISGDLTSINQLSQSFVIGPPGTKQLLKKVVLNLTKTGTPAGNIFVSINADNAGSPGVVLSDSSAILADSLVTGNNTIEISDIYLASGTYHIVVYTDNAYKASYVNGATEINLSSSTIQGITLDLRVRITSSAASKKLEGYGIFYDKALSASVASGSLNIEEFQFDGALDTYQFTLTKFLPHPDLLRVYDVNTGQVYLYGAFILNGQRVDFDPGQFYQPGQTIKLRFMQLEGSVFDSSDTNALLLAGNNLGSTEASLDRSSPGRGIFLRRPDGVLVEVTVDNSNNIVVYSV